MGASLFDGDELKKISDQFALTATSIGSHFASIVGIPANPADAQKNIDKAKSFVTKGIADVRINHTFILFLVPVAFFHSMLLLCCRYYSRSWKIKLLN